MSSTYAGNGASYPASITIPSDGDVRDAASVNAPLEGLADRAAYLKAVADRFAVLVPRQRDTASGVLASVGYGDPDVDVTLFTSSVPTEVGDVVTVTLSGYGRLVKAAATAGLIGMLVTLSANENGGGFVAIPQGSAFFSIFLTNIGTTNEFNIPMVVRGSFTVAAAGSLVVKATFSFPTGTNASDLVDFQNHSADLLIERA